MTRRFIHPERAQPTCVPGQLLVSSARLESNSRHDHLVIFNRGGNAGVLTLDAGDGEKIADLLGLVETDTEIMK